MKARYLIALMPIVLLWGCAASVDIDSMFRDFDDYEKDLRAVATDEQAIETLETGRQKRDEAGNLVDQGKKKDAVPIVEQAMADARLALEMDKMNASARRAEKCRLAVEQSRVKWREALFVLKQTEEFVGKKAEISKSEPEPAREPTSLPGSTLMPESFPPATIEEVTDQWTAWREAASANKVAAAELARRVADHVCHGRSVAQVQVPVVRTC